jgi:hypothetical protein
MHFGKKIVSVVAGGYHAIITTIDDEYYSFGCNA